MTDYADSRWMPPSPHREAILEQMAAGRAHLEERGHDLSPLLVWEDGGAMELALVRLVEGRLMAVADAQLPETSTKHVDVCGTIDELKRLWEAQPELTDTDPEHLRSLLDHAMKMLRRIEQRMDAYREFSEALGERVAAMRKLEHPDHGPAPGLAKELSEAIAGGGSTISANLESIFATAEAIRKIAGDFEQVLYRYRDLAKEVGTLYEGIRGGRAW